VWGKLDGLPGEDRLLVPRLPLWREIKELVGNCQDRKKLKNKGQKILRGVLFERDKPMPDREFYERRDIANAQFLHQAVAIRLNGFSREIEKLGNFDT
jgi:hypothetical protein